MVRTDSASVVGPHTWPIPPPPQPTRDTRKPVRPKTVCSMVSYSYVIPPCVRWYVASLCATALWKTGPPDGKIENREQTRLLLGHHVVPEGTDAADLDLHHVPRP